MRLSRTRVLLPGGQIHQERRYPVGRRALPDVLDADRDHGADGVTAADVLLAGHQPCPQCTGDHGQHDIVDRAAMLAADA